MLCQAVKAPLNTYNHSLTASTIITKIFTGAPIDTIIHIPKELAIPLFLQAAKNNDFKQSENFKSLTREIWAQDRDYYDKYNFYNLHAYYKLLQPYNFTQPNNIYKLLNHIPWSGKENPKYGAFFVSLIKKELALFLEVIPPYQIISRQIITFQTLDEFTKNEEYKNALSGEFEKLINNEK